MLIYKKRTISSLRSSSLLIMPLASAVVVIFLLNLAHLRSKANRGTKISNTLGTCSIPLLIMSTNVVILSGRLRQDSRMPFSI